MRANSSVVYMLAILGTMLPGCAEISPTPLSAEARAVELDQRRLDNPRLRSFIQAGLARHDTNDAPPHWNLAALTLVAIYYHPDIDIARAALALARASVITAGQSPNPTLNLNAVLTGAAVPGAIPSGALPLTIGPVIDLVIETAGRRKYRAAQAGHLAEAASRMLAAAGWQVRGRVRSALLDLWAARHRVALTAERLELQDRLVQLLEKRLEIGEAGSLEVSRERIARSRIALVRQEFEQAAAKAEAELAAAIGVPLKALTGAALAFDGFEHVRAPADRDAGELRRAALTGRADVQAALADYQGAEAGLQLAVAGEYPNLTLGPGYVYDAGVNRYNLSPSLELPVFHQHQGQVAEALARRQQAEASFSALQGKILAAIDSAWAGYHAAQSRLSVADKLAAAAGRRARQTQGLLRSGQADRPSLVTAELENVEARLARFDALIAQLQALGALEDALEQKLFEPEAGFSVPEQSPRPGAEPQS